MKLADLNNPVRFNWLADQGLRLDASPYLSGALRDAASSWNGCQEHSRYTSLCGRDAGSSMLAEF